MPDYRCDASSVDLFTADEHLVFCDWFGVCCPPSKRWEDILDEWDMPDDIDQFPIPSSRGFCSSGSRARIGWTR
jgi:hypothetical protein